MPETIHTARLTIVQKQRPNREAHLEGFEQPLRFGMHGGYSEFYKLPPSEKLPTTVDHLLAALAGWLTGTLAGALEARGIPTTDNLEADVEGQIIADGKIFRVGSVKIQYRLAIPAAKRAEADRALEIHAMYCPVHQSIQQGFAVNWSAEIRET